MVNQTRTCAPRMARRMGKAVSSGKISKVSEFGEFNEVGEGAAPSDRARPSPALWLDGPLIRLGVGEQLAASSSAYPLNATIHEEASRTVTSWAVRMRGYRPGGKKGAVRAGSGPAHLSGA